jgi:beta-N-acetylhexosaminidase
VGGVILFSRNYESPQQLSALTASIAALRQPALLIATDHEGGRVQRFRNGFTAIPPMRSLGERWQINAGEAVKMARACGYITGTELAAHGVDFSFAPVLDLDWGESSVIGNRSFSRQSEVVFELASALISGLGEAGVANCAKHFPGHGFVRADSHLEIPRDERTLDAIERDDMAPFKRLSPVLDSVMPAHVIYTRVDSQPAGFSPVWLQNILRDRLDFKGMIFSDDLSMEGASVAGDVTARAEAAFAAGCDMALLCNDPLRCDVLLGGLTAKGKKGDWEFSHRFEKMRARPRSIDAAHDPRYQEARAMIAAIGLD